MITRIVTGLFGWLMGLLVARGAKSARIFLRVEELEVRAVPATFWWADGTGDHKWGTAANWRIDDPDVNGGYKDATRARHKQPQLRRRGGVFQTPVMAAPWPTTVTST
jgi:hypothetical protein